MTYATHESMSALRRDILPGVQAVKTPVNHPDEISTLFDPSIVYAKGARLLVMLRDFVGDEAFQTGLRMYFDKHAYQNTEGNDLWNTLTESSGKNIGDFMNAWIEQPNLPIVSAGTSGGVISVTQQPFVKNKDMPGLSWPDYL